MGNLYANKDEEIVTDEFEKIVHRNNAVLCKELDELFEELQPITIDEMMGKWRVGYIFTEGTGSKFEKILKYLPRLYGKSYMSKNKVNAWVFSFFGIKFGFPGATAILETVVYRNKISTAMIYNFLPIIDHFRKVNARTLMGIMEIKGKVSVYFYIIRIHEGTGGNHGGN
ncbi:MAG: DUF4334 domain-containing protein [Spirochaetes bacterium]|jgi:hypothetical protein|nr:DUF4334 domain-containing protein [Spirochaetota bacterium]